MRRTLLGFASSLLATFALGNTYTVTSITDSGAGTLRQAILDANANPGADTIAFGVVGSGPHTISLAAENITGGCGGANFCLANGVTRGQMSAFLSLAFHLQ